MAFTPEIEARLVAAARAVHPLVGVTAEAFRAYLEGHPAAAEIAGANDEGERAAELWLSCALRAGDPQAAAAFDARYLGPLERSLAKMRLAPFELDEVKQLVRQKLLVAPSFGPAKVDEYAGRGRLSGLVQVVATREAISLLRRTRRDAPLNDDALAAPGANWDHGAEAMKGEYRVAFKEAFARAVSALEPRQRNILRLHLVGGVGLEELAKVYRVHRATIVRWLHGAREEVREATKKALRELLAVRADELESLMGFVQSRLDVSLEQLLSTHDEGHDDAPDQ